VREVESVVVLFQILLLPFQGDLPNSFLSHLNKKSKSMGLRVRVKMPVSSMGYNPDV
jgi:hypothetical protein